MSSEELRVDEQTSHKILSVLAFARRAGVLVCGQDSIKSFLLRRRGRGGVLVVAADGARLRLPRDAELSVRRVRLSLPSSCLTERLGVIRKYLLVPRGTPFYSWLVSLLDGGGLGEQDKGVRAG